MSEIGNITAFDKNAEGYDKNSDSQYQEGNKTIDLAVKNAIEIVKQKQLKSLNILDAGCGNGRTTIKLYKGLKEEFERMNSSIKISITGIDISPNMLKIAKERAKEENLDGQINFYCKNIEELTDDDGHFDLIFSNFVLHWCTPKIHSKFIERLSHGGALVANQGGKNHCKSFYDMAYALTKQEPFEKYFINWTIPIFQPHKDEMQEVLNKAGFKEASVFEDEYKDYNYEEMIETFINASLLMFKEQLPNQELKNMFDQEFRKLSMAQSEKYKYVYRLYITAKK